MRNILAGLWVMAGLSAQAGMATDTVTYWQIRYDKTVIIQSNVTMAQPSVYEITVKQGVLKDLTVSFVYDAQPATSSLTVKEKKEVLRTLEPDPVMGPYFVVPVRELIGTHQPNVRYELDLYYNDDRGLKDLKIGTVVFNFK